MPVSPSSPAIRRALSTLSSDFRSVILLAEIHEYTYDEIANAMHCPVGTVRSQFEPLTGEEALTLHVYIDRSVLEVYVNGRVCVTVPLAVRPGPRSWLRT